MNNTLYTDSFLITGKVRVTDPCYKKDTWCSYVMDNVLPGRYNTKIEEHEGRIATLTIYHESIPDPDISNYQLVLDAKLGVDSGQLGFFNEDSYPDIPGDFDGKGGFYDVCCNTTLEDPFAGLVNNCGVVSQSGYGDGIYGLYTYTKNNKIVAAMAVFIDIHGVEEEPEDN